jgi:hypothetical protein
MEQDYSTPYKKLHELLAQRSSPQGKPHGLYDKLQEQFAQRSCPQGKPHGCGL